MIESTLKKKPIVSRRSVQSLAMATLDVLRRLYRPARWAMFFGFLWLVGWLIHFFFQPQPLWSVRGSLNSHVLKQFTPSGSGLVLIETRDNETLLVVRDSATGADRFVIPILEKNTPAARVPTTWGSGRFWSVSGDNETVILANVDTGRTVSPNFSGWLSQGWPLLPEDLQTPFSQEEDLVVLESRDESIFVDTATGAVVGRVRDHYFRGWTPTHVILRPFKGEGFVFWDRNTRQMAPVPSVSGNLESVKANGDRFLLRAESREDNHSLQLWDAKNLKLVAQLEPDSKRGHVFDVDPKAIFSADGKTLALGGESQTEPRKTLWEFFDAANGHSLGRVSADVEFVKLGGGAELTPDGRRLRIVMNGRRSEMYAVPTGELLWGDLKGQKLLGFSADSRRVALLGSDLSIRDVDSGNTILTVAGSFRSVSENRKRTRRFLWATATGTDYRELGPLDRFLQNWLPSGVITEEVDIGQVVVLDMDLGTIHAHLENFSVGNAAVSSDGRFLATQTTKLPSIDPAGATRSGETVIHCWELPLRRPWMWIIGVPVGLGCILLVIGRWRQAQKVSKNEISPQGSTIA